MLKTNRKYSLIFKKIYKKIKKNFKILNQLVIFLKMEKEELIEEQF